MSGLFNEPWTRVSWIAGWTQDFFEAVLDLALGHSHVGLTVDDGNVSDVTHILAGAGQARSPREVLRLLRAHRASPRSSAGTRLGELAGRRYGGSAVTVWPMGRGVDLSPEHLWAGTRNESQDS